MEIRLRELECKEVVCVSDGSRLGYVCDVIIDVPEGRVRAIVVPGRGKMGGLMGSPDEFIIPWSGICRVGGDILLVDIKPGDCRCPRRRPKWFA